ncbi:MAG TPA: TraI domain-containing protein [Planctomycetota bacterium]|nr:TraI domain-containing protein [Planctomycetota bacterium]
MAKESGAESPVFPLCRVVLDEGLCTGEVPGGNAEVPNWKKLLDADGKTAVREAERAIVARSSLADQDYVSNVLQLFAHWALDLPASENHHHARPYGLFRHSAEVASATVQDLQERWSPGRGCILPPAEQALWLKVAFALGLLHDCGKILDLDVRGSLPGPCWDPFGESLAAWKSRHGKDALAPTSYQFRPGRGLTGHEQKGIRLLEVILAGPRWNRLRPPLAAAYRAFVLRHQGPDPRAAVPLAYLAERVHQADILSARRDRRKARHREQEDLVPEKNPSGRL